MKKFITTFLLLILIGGIFSFIYLRVSSQSIENNFFNEKLRYKFARYPFFRKTLALHFDGDARFDYLSPKYDKITVKIITMDGLYLNNKIAESFVEKVQKTTGKNAEYVYFKSIPFASSSSMENLRKQLEKNEQISSGDEAVLYVVLAGQNSEVANRLGSTLNENGVVFFGKTAESYMRNDNGDNFQNFATSLLLHEFGHQIGLPHNDDYGCLMNKNSDFRDDGVIVDINKDFCESEKKEISEMIY
jgi:predicted Zn-dependent protease